MEDERSESELRAERSVAISRTRGRQEKPSARTRQNRDVKTRPRASAVGLAEPAALVLPMCFWEKSWGRGDAICSAQHIFQKLLG